MDATEIEAKMLSRKLGNLEYNMYAYRATLDKIRIDLNYYRYVTSRLRKTLKFLKRKEVVVSINEYKKVVGELRRSTQRVEYFFRERSRVLRMLSDAEARYSKLEQRYAEVERTLRNRKVILIFRAKQEEK